MRAHIPSERERKLASQIKQIAANTLLRDMNDHALTDVTITAVRMTGDLQSAEIYWTSLSGGRKLDETKRALTKVTGRVRTAVASKINTRLAPHLVFKHDELDEQVSSIEDVIAQAKRADNALAKKRAGHTFAGEEDPYKEVRPKKTAEDFEYTTQK